VPDGDTSAASGAGSSPRHAAVDGGHSPPSPLPSPPLLRRRPLRRWPAAEAAAIVEASAGRPHTPVVVGGRADGVTPASGSIADHAILRVAQSGESSKKGNCKRV